MKKLLVLLFSLLISFNSYGGLFDKTVCIETDSQERGGLIYLPNKTKPFSGKNLCEYESGQYKSKGNVKKGTKDGNWTWWKENGFKELGRNYNIGELIGEIEYSYWNNGQIMYEAEYKNDKQDGKSTWWHENGQKSSEENHKNGLRHGKWISWYENGVKEAESLNKDGELNGKVTGWHNNGQKSVVGNWKDSKKDGKWTHWNENGQIESERTWQNGVCISGDCPD